MSSRSRALPGLGSIAPGVAPQREALAGLASLAHAANPADRCPLPAARWLSLLASENPPKVNKLSQTKPQPACPLTAPATHRPEQPSYDSDSRAKKRHHGTQGRQGQGCLQGAQARPEGQRQACCRIRMSSHTRSSKLEARSSKLPLDLQCNAETLTVPHLQFQYSIHTILSDATVQSLAASNR